MSVLRMTAEQYAEHLARTRASRAAEVSAPAPTVASVTAAPDSSAKPLTAKERVQALGRLKAGEMNKTEAAYAETLGERLRAGEIVWFEFEAVTLVLPGGVRYTPDFIVQLANGEVEFQEVKGYWEEDARVKIRLAAGYFPLFRFYGIRKRAKKNGGGWDVENFSK